MENIKEKEVKGVDKAAEKTVIKISDANKQILKNIQLSIQKLDSQLRVLDNQRSLVLSSIVNQKGGLTSEKWVLNENFDLEEAPDEGSKEDNKDQEIVQEDK